MKAQSLYRVLSVFVNIIAVFFAIALIFAGITVIANPPLAFGVFMMFGVVAYAWFAKKFYNKVIVHQQEFQKTNVDWLQVNAIVTFVFSVLSFQNSLVMLFKPEMVKPFVESLPPEVKNPNQFVKTVAYFLLTLSLVLMTHVIWTFLLLKAYKRIQANKNNDPDI